MNWTLLQNSLVVSGGATLLAVVVGFGAALWLVALPPAWRNRLLVAAVIALVLPPFLVTNCWLHFLGLTGVWRSWLPLNIYSLGGTIWILALLTWPIPLLATLGAWRRLESAQIESDPALSGAALVRWLLWPMARVAVGQASVLAFVLALNNFAVPAILQVRVFPAEVWVKFSTNFDAAGALALSWPMLVAPIALLLLLRRSEIKWPREGRGVTARIMRRQLGPCWFWSCGFLTVATLLMSVALPLLQILAVEKTWTELPNVFRAVPGVIWNSFALSAATASACVAIALAAAAVAGKSKVQSHRGGSKVQSPKSKVSETEPALGVHPLGCKTPPDALKRGHQAQAVPFSRAALLVRRLWTLDFGLWTLSLLWLPLLVPGVLLCIGLTLVFNRPVLDAIYHGVGMVLIAWIIRYLAVSANGVAFALQGVDRDLTDAARLSGASGWTLLRHIHWPQIAPQVGAAWYLTYLLCLWDVETLILIYPPGGETLALRIFNLLHYGHNAQVNALCLLLLVLAVAPGAAWSLGRGLVRE